MRRKFFVGFALLCIVGCQQHPQNGLGQAEIKSRASSMSDESQIKVVVCEYLIEKEIKPSSGDLLFVAVGDNELQELARKFPAYRLKLENEAEINERREVHDKRTKQAGVIMEVKSIAISDHKASVLAGYFAGAGITYAFKLEKKGDWLVSEVSGRAIGDPM